METSTDPLLETATVVRRVLRARVRDAHLVEDLAQETIVRVAAAQHRMAPDTLRAYAIVTARNLVTDHARAEERGRRHAHRLVEYRGFEGPEELALEREETDALAVALDRLDADDQRLLLQHEAEGQELTELADVEGTTPGALAMRLARARAQLRLEFVLAFRRATLPSKRCRSVLLAISAGDRRRQEALHAEEHLMRCPACASLARPLAERRRGIAIWAGLVAAFEAVRRLLRQRSVQVTAAVGVAGIGVLTYMAVRDDPAPVAAPPPVVTTVPTTAPVSTAVPTTAVPVTAAPVTSPPAVCPPAVPLAELGAAGPFGCPVTYSGLVVEAVPAEEGLWLRSPDGDALWVLLIGEGESPPDFTAGQVVDVTGVTRPVPADPSTIGAGPEDLDRLAERGAYIEARFDEILITSG